jgi:hypothetical protein
LFGWTTLAGAIWAIFFLPETGGYAIEDIHQLYNGNIIKQSLRDNKYLFRAYNNSATGAVDGGDTEHHAAKNRHDSMSKSSDDQIEKVREE